MRWTLLVIAGVAVLVVVVVVVVVVVAVFRRTNSDDEAWSAFPHPLSCHVEQETGDPTRWIDPPLSLVANQVMMTHSVNQNLRVTVDFTNLTPDAAGISYSVLLGSNLSETDSPALFIQSPHDGQPWTTDGLELEHPNSGILVSADNASSNSVTLDLDLSGQDKLLGGGAFTPSVSILLNYDTAPGASHDHDFRAQHCNW